MRPNSFVKGYEQDEIGSRGPAQSPETRLSINFWAVRRDGITHAAWGQRAQQLDALRNLTSLIALAVRGQFIFPGLGHDDPSAEGGSKKEPGDFSDLVSLWRPILPEEALTTFAVGTFTSLNPLSCSSPYHHL